MNIALVIVTYNRKALLEQCLRAVENQTRKPSAIFIIDNASTDGTPEWLALWLPEHLPLAHVISLPDNTGGAGGFAAGMHFAVANQFDWIWMMDDDAIPKPDALANLLDHELSTSNIYGSVAISGNQLCWPASPVGAKRKDRAEQINQLIGDADVRFIPFLGILVSADLIQRIGVPDAGFFLAADDVDYCLRARKAGAHVILVPSSQIDHPAANQYRVWFLPGSERYTLELPPWKRYYDVRNRLLVSKNHDGMKLWYWTLPASFLRLLATLYHEKRRLAQLGAFCAGTIDGLLNRKGKRHEKWGIRP